MNYVLSCCQHRLNEMDSYMYKELADLGSHELLRAFFLVMIGCTKTKQAKSYQLS